MYVLPNSDCAGVVTVVSRGCTGDANGSTIYSVPMEEPDAVQPFDGHSAPRARSVTSPACSKNSIRRMIRSALDTVAKERQIDPDEPAQPFSIARGAVEMLHQLLEQYAVSEFNQCSFILEHAKKRTCTPETMLCLKRTRMAAEQRPVFELPEAERPGPIVEGEGSEEEEDADFTGSEETE